MYRLITHLATLLLVFGFTANSGAAFSLSYDRPQYAISSVYRKRDRRKNLTHYRFQDGFAQSLRRFFNFFFSSFKDNYSRCIQTLLMHQQQYFLNTTNYISTLLTSWRSRHAKAKPHASK